MENLKIYKEEVFRNYIDLLNALLPSHSQFQYVFARKEHIDEFGKEIHKNDLYFKRQFDIAWDSVMKLSVSSMELLIWIIFTGSLPLELFAEKLKKSKLEYLREKINDALTSKEEH